MGRWNRTEFKFGMRLYRPIAVAGLPTTLRFISTGVASFALRGWRQEGPGGLQVPDALRLGLGSPLGVRLHHDVTPTEARG